MCVFSLEFLVCGQGAVELLFVLVELFILHVFGNLKYIEFILFFLHFYLILLDITYGHPSFESIFELVVQEFLLMIHEVVYQRLFSLLIFHKLFPFLNSSGFSNVIVLGESI